MSKCKYETKNGRCGLKDSYAYLHKCYTEEFCKCHEPITNADRIRAMSDKELADVVVCPHTGNWYLCIDDCKKCRLEWLKQPVGDDDG